MRTNAFWTLCFAMASLCSNFVGATAGFGSDPAEFASKLCRSGGGDWTRVVPVVVANKTNAEFHERVVSVPIDGTRGRSVDGALPLVGELAQSVRLCDAKGTEYVFAIEDADGEPIDKGRVPEKSRLVLPAIVPANGEATYYVFAGNDKAYPNPDRFDSSDGYASNLSFERGRGDVPSHWSFTSTGDGKTLEWSQENPQSGEKCVKCVVNEGVARSWIAARQYRVALEPKGKYRFEAWVRGRNVKGTCGWYLHIGNAENSMVAGPMLDAKKQGDFDWTKLSVDFDVPEKCDVLEFGTVLYGTGIAWYDSASLTKLDADGTPAAVQTESGSYGVKVGAEETLEVPESVYPKGRVSSRVKPSAARTATIRVDSLAGGERLVALDLGAIGNRWGRGLTVDDVEILNLENKPVKAEDFQGFAIFKVELNAGKRNYLTVVEKNDAKKETRAASKSDERVVENLAFPGTMLQTTDAANGGERRGEDKKTGGSVELPEFIRERNLVFDGDFEKMDPTTFQEKEKGADGYVWTRDAAEQGVDYEIFDSGVPGLGKQSFKMTVSPDAPSKWRGWRRRVAVEPGQTYLIGCAMATDSASGNYDLHMHWRKADGSLASGGMASLGRPLSGKTDWTLRVGVSRASNDSDFVELHLTNMSNGISEYDNVFVAAIDQATVVEFAGGQTGVFQVPAVAKVFPDTTFGANAVRVDEKYAARCALALDEMETLQIAFRPGKGSLEPGEYFVSAPAPKLDGAKKSALAPPEVFVISNVLVDYPSSYYNTKGDKTERKFPTGTPSCDGWIGYWPDPMIPIATEPSKEKSAELAKSLGDPEQWNDSETTSVAAFRGEILIQPDKTRAMQLRFRTTPETVPGVYSGSVTLTSGDSTISVPYQVRVLAFQAPETKVEGMYDARAYSGQGNDRDRRDRVVEKLLSDKLGPDRPTYSLNIRYDKETGTASADWTDFDAQTEKFFAQGGKTAYYPGDFYLFGWGLPPKNVEGETPYEGEWPFDGKDRAVLRPEYKKAYQTRLKLFYDHIKEKGWADKLVLYISDEPFYSKPEILAQMKALCDMIHEVDPAIPIYASTWVFVPEWLRYIDVWGIGHYGIVSEESLETIRSANGRVWWTTDGMMCLDTPLCAVERLLPYTCVRRDAEVYEFWGASWYTCNPFDSASHLYIPQSDQPGVHYFVRYPNGDGYIYYPGETIGRPGELLSSIRSEQAREGVEDAGWLVGLRNAIEEKTEANSPERAEAERILVRALDYLPLNCGSGRYSTRYISDPYEFEQIRLDVGLELEKLSKR